MPAAALLAGADVLQARIEMALRGRWTVAARIAAASAPSGRATFECADGLTLSGTIARAQAFAEACDVWLVGGAGGLHQHVTGAWQFAQLRDPLEALARATGETLSSTIGGEVLGLALERWSMAGTASAALDALAAEAAQQLREVVRWRVLDDGTLWLGRESWPSAFLPAHAQLLDVEGSQGAVYLVGSETPTVQPGQDIDGIGRVVAVRHRIDPDEVRSRLFT